MSKLRSMTGFANLEAANENISLKIEIRSLNGKFFEFNPRISKLFRDKETEIRQWASAKIGRGSVQISIQAELSNNSKVAEGFNLNHTVAKGYMQKISPLVAELNLDPSKLFEYLVQLPEVVKLEDPKTGEEDWNFLMDKLEETFAAFDKFRTTEGVSLANDLMTNVNLIDAYLKKVVELDEERKQLVRAKLEKSVADIKDKVQLDEKRFEYEVLYYLEKLDINEEQSRLTQHLQFFTETLEKEPTGKKLGFITQEMGREINTLGSKANYFPMQKLVVDMKDALEKIKEQVLNVL